MSLSNSFRWSLTVLVLISLSMSTLAAQAYKYQDENGVWHFSQQAPDVADVESIQVNDSSEKRVYKDVWVKENLRGRPSLTVINNYYGPIQANIELECKADCEITQINHTKVVPARGEALAVLLKKSTGHLRAVYDLNIILGDPNAVIDEDYPYAFPFPQLEPFLITQSFNGEFSHNDAMNVHAIDVALDISTPISAARDGVVMAIAESHTEAGTEAYHADKANSAYLLHDDGAISVYAHLDMFSVVVEPGDRVEKHQFIARSGNTGFSTGPHLHFAIWRNDKGTQRTVPFQFDDGVNGLMIPLAGQNITHGYGEVKQETIHPDWQAGSEARLALLSPIEEIDGANISSAEEVAEVRKPETLVEQAKQVGKQVSDFATELFDGFNK